MQKSENISMELWERFENYVHNTMEYSERLEFESLLESDPGLKKQLNEAKSLILGVETAVLKEKLDDFHDDLDQVRTLKPVSKRNFTPSKWAIAAVLAAAIGIFWFFNSESQNDRLFAAYFEPDPGLPTTMSTESDFEFFDAMVNYKREEYEIAIEKWEKLLQEKPNNDTLNYFLGVSYLAQGNSPLADEFLQKLTVYPNSIFSEDAVYYRALALLKNGEKDEAVLLLTANPSERNSNLLQDLR